MSLKEKDDLKPKSIIINGILHNTFGEFCKKNKLKIGGITENLIEKFLKEKGSKQD